MVLIIRDKNGLGHYIEVTNALVNKKCEVVLVSNNGFTDIDLSKYAGCDAVLMVGNRTEFVTISDYEGGQK